MRAILKNWSARLDEWVNQYRPVALLALVAITVLSFALVDWATGSNLAQQLFYPKRETAADVRFWSALVYALAFALGLPVAFLIWHWRDRNARDQIENARKDVNLKEFQEVQIRAAGLFEKDKHPAGAAEQLQIAALHQLRAFLKGDYGKDFKRPAFELLCARISNVEIMSYAEWGKATTINDPAVEYEGYDEYVDRKFKDLDAVSKARISIIHDEWHNIFRAGFPLQNRDFSFVRLPHGADLSGIDLTGCRFIRSSIDRVNFQNSILRDSVLDRTFANGACFSNVKFFGANLNYCGLATTTNDYVQPRSQSVDFSNADLTMIRMQYSSVLGANLQGARFFANRVEGSHFVGCHFDNKTELSQTWKQMTSEEKEVIRQSWLGRGAVNVDAPHPQAADEQ